MDKHCLSATTHLPACLPACLPGCSPATAHLPATAYLPACLFTTCLCLPAYLPACSPATALQVEEVVAENEALRVSLKHASDSQARQAGTERQVINVAASPLLAEENDLLRQVRVLRLVRARRGRAGIGGEMWGLISGRPCMTHGPALPCMTHGHVPCMTHDPALCPCLAQENDLLVQQQSELDSEIVRLHRQMEDQAQAGMRSAQEQAVLSSRLQQATSLVQVGAGCVGGGGSGSGRHALRTGAGCAVQQAAAGDVAGAGGGRGQGGDGGSGLGRHAIRTGAGRAVQQAAAGDLAGAGEGRGQGGWG